MAPVWGFPCTASLEGYIIFGQHREIAAFWCETAAWSWGHQFLVIASPVPPQPWPAGIPSWEGRGVSLRGLRPIFLIKQLGEGCSDLPTCFHSTGRGETATNWLIRDVGCVVSGEDDCVLLARSRLACLSMVMHSLVLKSCLF